MRCIRLVFIYLIMLSSFLFSTSTLADPWKFDITPYLWAINMNGRVTNGPATLHINQSFSDLLNHLEGAGMLYATAHKDAFGLYFDGVYAVLSNSQQISMINTSARNNYGVFGGGISYIVLDRELQNQSKISLEPYVGVRYTLNNTTLKVSTFSFKRNVNWTDPVVGMKLAYTFNKKWSAYLMGDVGGTNTSTHYSYNAGAFLGYQPTSWHIARMYLGYRLLDQHYQTGNGLNYFNWNMKLFGPVIGIGFTF